MSRLITIHYVIGLLTCLIGCVFAVSFYGESYIHIPYEDDFHDTDIELRFKASRPYGILLLLTGGAGIDFLLLQLHAGTLQLKVNYGSEETLLDLGRHRYDDLEWHEVKVTRSDNIISMVIDGTTTVRQRINGKYRELNINKGVFLGGTDSDTNQLFDSELKNFRGTFSTALLNGVDLIAKARELNDLKHVVEVSFDNDDIFDAPRHSPISLMSETSYISFSHVHPTYDRTVSFQFWTDSPSALLMFSFTRHSSRKNFFALELINDQLVLTGGKGEERIEVISHSLISGKWHQLDVTITSELVELSVNGVVKSQKFLDRSGAIYGGMIHIGGVNQRERSVVIREGLKSLQGENTHTGSMIGCIKNIVINSRVYSIHDIHASRLISSECDIRDGCSFVGCNVDDTPYADSNLEDFQLLAVNPVIVNEGKSSQITTDNIEIVYDFKQYGIRESGIMIYVVEKPKYGEIQVDLGRRRNSDVFTYLDLIGNKVQYIHHGSENDYDEVSMGLEIYSSSRASEEDFPERLQQRYKFILHITIKLTNDAPKIILANNGVLRIIENTKILITSDVMVGNDPDTDPKDLTYTVADSTQGYFEKSGRNGVPITNFTQKDIDDQQIWFLHLGSGDAFVGLTLSDGTASSELVRLNIQTVRLRLMVQKKTGLVLPHGSYAVISSANLTTVSNVPTQELEIRYEILNPPRFGVLERQQYANGEWQEVSTFAQRHIDSGHVRYRQTDMSQSPSSDQFRFKVKAKTFTTPYDYFRIQFEQVYIEIVANNKLTLLHQPYGVLSSDNLRAVTNNPHLQDDQITFTIIRPPSLGNFYKVDPRYRGRIDFFDAMPLMKESSFSQHDINMGSIYYKLKSNSYEKITDFSDIRVYTLGTTDKVLRMWIEFVPMKSDVRFINNGLSEVIEGGQKAIDKHCLFIQTNDFRSFEFTITTSPRYGTLQLVDPRSSVVLSDDINEFTSEDIKDLRLVYKHDDSEHDTDSFTFTAVPDIEKTFLVQNIPEFTGVFEIQMLMRNDNPPERLVDEIFRVVRNGEKLITIDDLAFMDPDLDYDTGELMYERRGIPNGQIVFAKNKTLAYNFHQKDIVNNEIMFQHSGEDKGEALIYVTDGQYYQNCLLEIEAGEPYIKVNKNTGAVVRRRSEVVISIHNISIETNVNLGDEFVRFVVIEEPEEGFLEIEGRKVIEFDLKSLKQGKVMYKNEGHADTEDYFIFAVVADEVRAQGKFSIQIVLESTQLPRVINNKPLEMFGSHQKNTILKEHLLITHPDSTAETIEYLILVMPKHGHLYRGETLLTTDGESTFTQLDINNDIVKYELDNTSAMTDQFIFEVSNGYEALRGLEFLIDIIPYTLVFETGNLSVIEGGKKAVSSDLLRVNDKNSDYQSIQYMIQEKPLHGIISNNKGETLRSFTSVDVGNGNVFYIHDDGESKVDWFAVSASVNNGAKESEVKTVYINIQGINDEAPVVVRNTGLKVWKGSLTQITSDNLYARDPDTPASDLTYRISTPTNGHISHLNNTFKAIASFKQSWIDDGRIVFVHEGEASGYFSFEVNDGGSNKSPLTVFRVEARQLLLNLLANNLLDAYPNTIQPITASHLFTSTNDPNQTKPIIYTVTSMPKRGTLVTIVNGRPVQVTSFNQQAINDSKIFYKHADTLSVWFQKDHFEFQVNTLYAEPSEVHTFNISISFANLNPENKDQLIRTSPIHVDEGGEMILAKNNLDVSLFVTNLEVRLKRVSLTFSLEDKPRHGVLTFRNQALKKNIRFSQRNVNSHEIMYKHDDSDTTFDTFNLTLHLRIEDLTLHSELNDESTFRLVLNVTVQPVNDENFELLTKSPSLQIVQGFTGMINKSILNTVDNDTMPAYIVYEIIREPDNGHVAYKDDVDKKILNFSQRDVNDGLVVFKHKSYKDSGEFYFRVSDGSHSPFYKLFKVQVTKLFVNVSKNATVELLQSDSVAHLTQDNLDILTNGLRKNVYFILAGQPRYGKLYVNNEVKNTFTQKDVDDNRIVYKQSELEHGSDYIPITKIVYKFKRSSQKDFFTVFPLHINIKVKPFVVSEPLFAPRGEHVALTVHSLDAVKLSERTGDNPRYRIKSGPYFGKVFIYRKSISKRQIYHENYKASSGYKPVSDFTHEDVVYTRVFYKSDSYVAPSASQDNFTYVLTAFNAQPAEGVFYIDLEPSEDFPVVPDTESPDSGAITEKSVTQSSEKVHRGENSAMNNDSVEPSRLKYDHVLILAISIPLLIIIIIAFIVVYFVWRGRRKRDYTPSSKKSPRLRPHISGPFQIEQPHVHIEPQDKHSQASEDEKSLVEYENTHNIPGVSRAASEEADVIMPMLSHQALNDQYFGSRSPDMSRTEVSCTVPTCKVTPMVDNELEGAVGGVDEDHRQSISSMGDMIEWITNDPELLQNCSSSSPPILRKSRYWV